MTDKPDKAQVGLSSETDDKLKSLLEKDDGPFARDQDVYRLAVAIALAEGLDPAPESRSYDTKFAAGGVDPDQALRSAIQYLRDDHDGRPAALMERLAEAGVERIYDHVDSGKALHELLTTVSPAVVPDPANGEPTP